MSAFSTQGLLGSRGEERRINLGIDDRLGEAVAADATPKMPNAHPAGAPAYQAAQSPISAAPINLALRSQP